MDFPMSEIYLWNLFVFHLGNHHYGSSFPHSGTLGFQTGGLTKYPGDLLTLHIQLIMSKNNGVQEQQMGISEGTGGAMHGWSHLLPILSHKVKEAHKCRIVWTTSFRNLGLHVHPLFLYLCRQLLPPFSERIPREKSKKCLIPTNRALQRSMRKDTVHLFLKKVYLLSRLTFFLPFLL